MKFHMFITLFTCFVYTHRTRVRNQVSLQASINHLIVNFRNIRMIFRRRDLLTVWNLRNWTKLIFAVSIAFNERWNNYDCNNYSVKSLFDHWRTVLLFDSFQNHFQLFPVNLHDFDTIANWQFRQYGSSFWTKSNVLQHHRHASTEQTVPIELVCSKSFYIHSDNVHHTL